jgi:hypothetical protein
LRQLATPLRRLFVHDGCLHIRIVNKLANFPTEHSWPLVTPDMLAREEKRPTGSQLGAEAARISF